jgi:solute:Na+ symporter, SSS family
MKGVGMRTLSSLDYSIIGVYGVLCLVLGVYYTRRASKNINEFFLTGRSMPWWLIGVSMAATNFSIDTPLAITKYVYREGIGGVWFFWASAISALLATFFFATLWRRAEVMTDAEIIEHRYSGPTAAFLRVFKGCYFGIVINCFVMGWVMAAFIKVMTGLTTLDLPTVVLLATALVGFYSLASGLYGVLLTDFAQYGIALGGSFLLAYLAVQDVGGMSVLLTKLEVEFGASSGVTNFVPNLSDSAWMPLSVFFAYIWIQWWAHKYADGGGKHIQRMSAAKDEKHAVLATFFFAMMNYAIQVWPWIITALCALVIFGRDVADPEMTYVWMIGRQMPHGILGLMVVTLIAAFMSTMSTHLNLGGSYLVNDIYKRFIKTDGGDRHYVLISRIATLILLAIGVCAGLQIKSIGSAWKFILAFTSGAGLTYIIRWLWWRANAWTEIVGMSVSGIVAIYIKLTHDEWLYSTKLFVIVGISTVAWLIVTFLTKPVEEERLVAFVRKVRPGTPGWKHIYKKYDIPYVPYGRSALWNFLVGVTFFFATNFGVGSVLLQDFAKGVPLLLSAVVLFIYLLKRINLGARKEAMERQTDAA